LRKIKHTARTISILPTSIIIGTDDNFVGVTLVFNYFCWIFFKKNRTLTLIKQSDTNKRLISRVSTPISSLIISSFISTDRRKKENHSKKSWEKYKENKRVGQIMEFGSKLTGFESLIPSFKMVILWKKKKKN